MQRDIEPNEIDWVFCWRTSTGDVRPGARDRAMNGKPVRYQPNRRRPDEGLRTIVRGRIRTCPLPPTGPRLDQQGGIARMGIFVAGYVTHPHVVPARDERELEVLRAGARAAVLSGDTASWALAAIHATGGVRWGLHLDAPPPIVRALADRVDAPWTLVVKEGPYGDRQNGSQIVCFDREERVILTVEADAIFDDAPLPDFAQRWRANVPGGVHAPATSGGGHFIAVPYPRPTGPHAWERWLLPDDSR